MVKRAIIRYNSSGLMVRVSPPGVDAETATIDQLLMHESSLLGQLYMVGYTAITGSSSDIVITYPTLGYAPRCMVYHVLTGNVISHPSRYRYQVGGTTLVVPATIFKSEVGKLTLSPISSMVDVIGIRYLIFRNPI